MPTKLKARTAAAAVAGKNGHSLISGEKFKQLYAALVKYDLLREHLGDRLGSSAAAADAAASAVGITLDLEREDTVVLGPRIFAANFIKGVPLRALLNGNTSNFDGGSFIYTGVNALNPGTAAAVIQAGLAAGAALASKMAGNRKVAVAFIDGGAAALKECGEAVRLASTHKLPVLYVIHASPDRKLEQVLSEAAEFVPVITVDANDVVAIYRVAQESIARTRDGDPSLIVCVPFRQEAAERPSIHMERYLTGKKLFRNRWKEQAVAEFEREMSAACLPQSNLLA